MSLAESVAGRLREAGQLAGMVSTEIKYHTFQSVSHQTTLTIPICTTDAIYKTACVLFDEIWNGTPIRLLGIRTSKLVSQNEPIQMSLFDLPRQSIAPQTVPSLLSLSKTEKLDDALDVIRKNTAPILLCVEAF